MKEWIVIGAIALGLGCSHMHEAHEDEGEEANEVKMSINDVPAPVRSSLMQQADGATITSVDREEENGKLVYETDVMSNGQNWEIKVDPNGHLVSKRLDDESQEKKSEKNEHEEHEEHGEH